MKELRCIVPCLLCVLATLGPAPAHSAQQQQPYHHGFPAREGKERKGTWEGGKGQVTREGGTGQVTREGGTGNSTLTFSRRPTVSLPSGHPLVERLRHELKLQAREERTGVRGGKEGWAELADDVRDWVPREREGGQWGEAGAIGQGARPPPVWPELDMSLAMSLARIEIVTYCSSLDEIAAWNCTRCADVSGFEPTDVVFDANKDVMGMTGWSSALGAKVVAFRGTNSHDIWNWADDMRAWRIDFQVPIPGADGAKIHAGFWGLFAGSALADNITAAYGRLLDQHPEGPTYILGHSMGGALAQLCALWFKATFRSHPLSAPQDLRLVTWGSPRVGNGVYAGLVLNVSSGHWRFTHGRDVVPSVPPQVLGYTHAPQEMWLIEVTDTQSQQVFSYVVECNMSGEDPLCHNSVCHLGICTSVVDHLDYMGLSFYQDATEC